MQKLLPQSLQAAVNIEFCAPADMASHWGMFQAGGVKDKEKKFCFRCHCLLSERDVICAPFTTVAGQTVADVAAQNGAYVKSIRLLNKVPNCT